MKKIVVLAMLCCAVFAVAAEPENLLKEPMTISNPNTTVLENGVYTITHTDAKQVSQLKYKVAMPSQDIHKITFAVEAKAMENTGNHGCYFGMILNLIHVDGTRTPGVNFGSGKDTFDWSLRQRPFAAVDKVTKAPKPIKEIEVIVQYYKIKGKVAFRNPQLYIGFVKAKAAK